MAITTIHPVKIHFEACNSYTTADKVKIDPVTREVTVFKTINSTLNCTLEHANEEWNFVKEVHNKKDGTQSYHFIQSFEGTIDPKLANEIGRKFAEEVFPDYQCIISTHTNTEYTHNHITFNSVSIADGRKYNDCLKSYKHLRQVSDRLCREYGLMVLEGTKDFNLIKFKTQDGITKYYEPTKRKDDHREGEFANKDDYRNTTSYQIDRKLKGTNRDIIKTDIDNLIPTVSSFEELLSKLREIGYEIKDKKATGDWRKYISYKAPTQLEFSRDYLLSKDGKYTRESLERVINSQEKETIRTDHDAQSQPDCDIVILLRRDVSALNKKLDNEYKQALSCHPNVKREVVFKNRRSQYLLDRINKNMKTIDFLNQKNIVSFQQVNHTVSALYVKRDAVLLELSKIRNVLKKMNETMVVIEKKNALQYSIDQQMNDSGYANYEASGDNALLHTYETFLEQRNILGSEAEIKFMNAVEKYNKAYSELGAKLEFVSFQIKEYDDCMSNIHYVDRQYDNQYQSDFELYLKIKSEHDKESKNQGKEKEHS